MADEIGYDRVPARSKKGPPLALALCLTLLCTGAAAFYWARGVSQLTACQSNLYGLSGALQYYARDHRGSYPKRLDEPGFEKYHGDVPACPAAEHDTYSQGYQQQGKVFTLRCNGDNHRHFLPGPKTSDYPCVGSEIGLQISDR